MEWKSVGPFNVGGRTRAIALDVTNDNIIIAGGVTGGMWRSTDEGKSWQYTNGSDAVRSVTCIAQDTRPGKEHILVLRFRENRMEVLEGQVLTFMVEMELVSP